MGNTFSTTTIEELSRQLREPSWLTQLRQSALKRHQALPWPHASDDIWRRTDVSLLDPMRGFAPSQPSLLQAVALTDIQLAGLTQPLGQEQLLVRVNGTWLSHEAPQGISIEELTMAAQEQPESIRPILEADGLTEAEQKFTSLNSAFHHDDLVVEVPANLSGAYPIRLVHVWSASGKQALFPMTIIRVGAGSSVVLIDEYISLEPTQEREPHLVNGRIELFLEPQAHLHYVRLQRWGPHAREFLFQRATLGRGATFTMANLHLGASISKAHSVVRLMGEQASSKLYGFVFGTGTQHVDQHTLQDHQAPHTTSDLEFRAALQDASRMIYTGLIRIAREAKQTNAFQANRNLILGQHAQAETIPMLEILADDVQCKHGASTGPIDEEQAFYLMSRAIPKAHAERLIVMGFVEPIVQQVPFEPLQQRLRQDISATLHGGPADLFGGEGSLHE